VWFLDAPDVRPRRLARATDSSWHFKRHRATDSTARQGDADTQRADKRTNRPANGSPAQLLLRGVTAADIAPANDGRVDAIGPCCQLLGNAHVDADG
jgi:hypothetical protein